MRDYYADAIDALVPNNETVIDGSKVTWIVKPENIPTDEQITAKIEELKNAEPYRLLRIERDRLLKETDWRASSDLNLPESWRAYRQALRDLPANAKPKLDENDNLDMSSVTWPSPST